MIVTEKKENFCLWHHRVKLLTRLRLQFIHLKKHKFRPNFGDTVSPMFGCNAEIEDTEHFFLRCHFHSMLRFELFHDIAEVDLDFTKLDTKEQVNILLYGYPSNKSNVLNQDIIKFVVNFLKESGRFDKSLISFNQ